jgi:cytochrome P450
LSSPSPDLFERRRRDPGDDLISALIKVGDDGGLTTDELLANVWLLFAAGHETTRNLIGNGLLALHTQPDMLRRLQADPTLIPAAVIELLRYDSPVQYVGRIAFEDVQIGDSTIRKNQIVLCLVGAGNRDPAVFPNPDRIFIDRSDNKPLSFGGGIHHCLGAQLTQIEGQEALAGILGRLPGMRLRDADHPSWQPDFAIRRLRTLPASW